MPAGDVSTPVPDGPPSDAGSQAPFVAAAPGEGEPAAEPGEGEPAPAPEEAESPREPGSPPE
ncbi:MAG: lytic murein transglycosylase, partial [Pseudonocardiaceae bacterium]